MDSGWTLRESQDLVVAELRGCAVVETAVLGSPVPNKPFMVYLGVKQHQRKKAVESPLSADVLCG